MIHLQLLFITEFEAELLNRHLEVDLKLMKIKHLNLCKHLHFYNTISVFH